MKKIKFGILLFVTISLTYLLNNPIPLEDAPIPPLGKLLNPFTGFWQNAENITDLNYQPSLDHLHLDAPAKVIYDDKLVPHIFANSMKDAITVQGYIEAQHRLWQMDFATRAQSGRLSEVVGAKAINYDKHTLRKGMVYAAKNTLKTWKTTPEKFEYAKAYANGVNAYIDNLSPKDYPVEFKILDYQPEKWTPLKSAIFMKAMASDLSFREEDIEATNALATFGRDTFDFLYPERSSKEDPIIPKSVKWNFKPLAPTHLPKTSLEPAIGAIFHEPLEKPSKFNGSNNWAVSGSKTASGNPILCNDPHLSLTLPAIWFEIQIHTPEINVYGVSLPGTPGVVIGFNENVAWGFTNVGHDVADWYKIKWTDETKTAYFLDDKILPVKIVVETIKVKGQADVLDTVRYTYWGPVSYEKKGNPYQDLALHWLAHESKGNELTTFLGLNAAKNFDDYYNGIRHFDNPAQNMAFISKDGDIALKVQGKFPIKEKEQGRFVRDGSLSSSGWHGFIPFEQTPFVKNPERGYVSSANQFSADTTYPYYYNGGFESFRGRTLNQNLDTMFNITIQDMMDLQQSTYSLKAKEALPLLLGFLGNVQLTPEEQELIDILKKWNYQCEKNATAPILFNAWFSDFYKTTWDEIYNLDQKEFPMLFPETWRTIELMQKNGENIFFDNQATPEKETAKDIALIAFRKMAKKAKDWKKDGKYISWEEYRDIKIPHIIKGLSGFRSDFVSAGGNWDALNTFSIRRNKSVHGPSWRMIVELDKKQNKVKAYGVYPAGQSGNPGSRFYDSMIETWAEGKYYDLLFLKNENEKNKRILFTQTFQ